MARLTVLMGAPGSGKISGAEVCRIHADVQKQIPGLAGEGFGSVRVTRDRR